MLMSVDALFQPFPMIVGRRGQIWRHQPQFRRPRHFHEEPEINVVVAGRCVMGIGERTLQMSAGDVLFFQPGQDHVLLEASDDLDLFVMALRPELAKRAAVAGVGAKVRSHAALRFPLAYISTLREKLIGVGSLNDGISHEDRVADLFLKLRSMPVPGHVLTKRALRSIIADPSLSLSTLARRFRTTTSSVSRHFHQDLGLTLTEHRSRMRLIRFVDMVDQGMELTDAALAAGFGSYAQFHRAFRRAFGCAPRDYFAALRGAVADATFESVERGGVASFGLQLGQFRQDSRVARISGR